MSADKTAESEGRADSVCHRLQPVVRPGTGAMVWRNGSDTSASFAALQCFSYSGNPGDW